MKLASEVFGINRSVNIDSYVDRGELDRILLKNLGRDTHIALRGESKCGKSWLRQKIVPDAIVVQCRLGKSVIDIYTDALAQLDIRLTTSKTGSKEYSGRVEAGGKAGDGLLEKVFGFQAELDLEGSRSSSETTTQELFGKDIEDLKNIAEIIKNSGKRLVIEDFHYLSIPEREKFAFDLKALWDYELFVMLIGVWSQSNMLLYLNDDLSGRIEELSISWQPHDLKKIMDRGGQALKIRFSEEFKKKCVGHSYNNAGLLQSLVLKSLDELGIDHEQKDTVTITALEAIEAAALYHADQLSPRYQQFARRVSSGIRTRQDSTGIYAHAMAAILETDDSKAVNGIHVDEVYRIIHAREPRVQKGNLKTILEKFESLQVDENGRGLVIAYNEATNEITIVDRTLLLYRRYATVQWPWEKLIHEALDQ